MFNKKNKNQKSDWENQNSFYGEWMLFGFIVFIIAGVCFGIYKLIEWLFL